MQYILSEFRSLFLRLSPIFRSKVREHFRGVLSNISLKQRLQFRQIFKYRKLSSDKLLAFVGKKYTVRRSLYD